MMPFMKRMVKKLKLALLWVRRILLAPNHFNIGPIRKLWLNLHGYITDQYAIYDFKRNDRHGYLSEFDWYRSRWINEPFDQMLNNKIICTKVLENYAYVPQILMMKNKGCMVSLRPGEADGYCTVDDVFRLLREFGALFMKPLAAGKGKDVHRLAYTDGRFIIDAHESDAVSIKRLLMDSDGWFLSEGIAQSEFLDHLYDKTANTIRIITLRDPESGIYRVFFAVLRIGTSATIPVDNGSSGALVSKIDLETGSLSVARSLQALGSHSVHPDSGAVIENAVIPDWEAVKAQILDLARLFPFMNFIAWDVLLTERGPCIIEANTSSGVNIIQLWGPQRNGELGDFYRAHGVIH